MSIQFSKTFKENFHYSRVIKTEICGQGGLDYITVI